MAENQSTSEMKSLILDSGDYREFNKDSCLNGIPLNKLKQSYIEYTNGQINADDMLGDVQIAFMLHQELMPEEIESVLSKRNLEEEEVLLINPLTWKLKGMSRKGLADQTKDIIDLLGKAVELANNDM